MKPDEVLRGYFHLCYIMVMARGKANSSLEKPLKVGRQFILRLPHNADIIEHLTDFCAKSKISCAAMNIIGAVSRVTLGYYDQKAHKYSLKTLEQEMEIVSCMGNVSMKEGKPFLHLHAVLSDTDLHCWGGHMSPGSAVFAAEAHIQELKGAGRVRMPDAVTGLALWCRQEEGPK